MELSTLIITLVIVSAIIACGILLSLYRERQITEHSQPLEVSDSADERSATIIQRASKQARDILVHAELTGIKEIARKKHDVQKFEDHIEDHLKELARRSADHLEKTSSQIEQHYIDLFHTTEEFVSKQIKDNQIRIINQLDLVTQEAEKTINTQAAAARKELVKRMDAELKAAKDLIREYKHKRMEIIDREIVELVSETIKKTLGKTLSKKDHADLIYKALQQAKQDGFFN